MIGRRYLALFASLVAVLASCGGSDDAPSARVGDDDRPRADARRDASFDHGKILIDTDEGSVLFDVEIAESSSERAQVLRGQKRPEGDDGTLSVFFEPTRVALRMEVTPAPLSAAFIDERGRIVRILDVDTCAPGRCEDYNPGAPYTAVLLVERGAFDRGDVETGDLVTLTR